jgi:choline dehydrogenase-like flavoprotein
VCTWLHHTFLFQQPAFHLPAAEATGKLTLRPMSVVHSLIFDPKTRRITGVRVIDAQSKAALEFHAKIVFLCASTLESARILMNSAHSRISNGTC